jgi:hypothetical protein
MNRDSTSPGAGDAVCSYGEEGKGGVRTDFAFVIDRPKWRKPPVRNPTAFYAILIDRW